MNLHSDSDIPIQPYPASRPRWWHLALTTLLPLAILGLLFTQISLTDITDLLRQVDYRWILLGCGFYGLTNLLRGLRVRVLLTEFDLPLPKLFSVMIAQSMFNNILPARVGEVSFVYLLYKHQKIPLEKSTIALIIARLSDYLAVATIFVSMALLSLDSLPAETSFIIGGVLLLLVGLAIAILSAAWLGRRAVSLLTFGLGAVGLTQVKQIGWLLDKLNHALTAFETVNTLRKQGTVFGWSLLVWGGIFGWFFAFMQGLGVTVTPQQVVLGSTFAVLSKAIPFLSLGGVGAHELGWAVGFTLVGFDQATAIASGLTVNLLTILTSVLFGLCALLYLRR